MKNRPTLHMRGSSKFDTRWTPPDILAMSANWPRVSEAKNFFQMVQRGVMTLEQAESDIRMSVRHRDFLIGQAGDETLRRSIQAVFRAREQTWEAFQLLCAGEELEEKASAYASDYSEVT